MGNGQLVVSCDLGTSAFRVLVSEVGPGRELEVLGTGTAPAAGFRDGDFVDMRAGQRALQRAVRAAEAAADVDIAAFFYNISGSHLHALWARGQVQIGPPPRAISAGDLASALARARSIAVPFDHWILAANPVDYAVDRVRGIVDPRGRIGSQLEVEAHLVTGSRSVVRNVENAITTAGYAVAGRGVDVLAAAGALLQPPEREEGVLLIDVGAKATQWALFRQGRIVGNGLTPWGGHHLTVDLAHGLRIDLAEAERIKLTRGIALRSLVDETDPDRLFEEACPAETPGLLAAILEPRLEEIYGLVKQELGDQRLLGPLGRGVVLTGGGSRCRGSTALAEDVFGMPACSRYLPPRLRGAERLGEGQWATALGLALAAAEPRPREASVGQREEGGRLWGRLRGLWGRQRREQTAAAAAAAQG